MTSLPPIAFSASRRTDHLADMVRAPLDVLVIGGGITGVGCALDAVSRGLRVGIIERDDWGVGTSSRSSKMIHGGLRYLANGDVAVVRESLRERRLLQRNAAHLVRPLSMLLPVYGNAFVPRDRAKIGAGLWAYEVLGHRRAAGGVHKWRSLDEVTRLVPNIATHSEVAGGTLRGAHHYHDDCADDMRLVLGVLRAGVARGLRAVNGANAVALLTDSAGAVRGATVSGDAAARLTGRADGTVDIEARCVINATGVWADQLEDENERTFELKPSKGIHLTVARDVAGIESGIAFFEQMGNANVFLEPWQDDLAFIGTTDTPYEGDLANPQATEDEIAWLLKTVNQFLGTAIERDDVVNHWAGLRPLVVPRSKGDDGERESKDVSRRHFLQDKPGLITITGGKLTAYRAMAEHAVDAAIAQLGLSGASHSSRVPLDGCMRTHRPKHVDRLAAQTLGLEIDRADLRHFLRRHGSNAEHMALLMLHYPELAKRLHPERPYLAVEAYWAREFEQARSISDITERRTRLSLETRNPQLARDTIGNVLDGDYSGVLEVRETL